MKNISLTFAFLLTFFHLYSQSGDLNMKIIAHVPAPQGGSGIWHYVDKNGIEYAAIGTKTSLIIYSLEDPTKPIERARLDGVNTTWREVYAYKNHIYAVTDSRSDGVVIVNMENAPTKITSKFWTANITANNQTADITTCHTVFVDEKGILCLNGCSPWQGVLFFDVNQDPENPKFLGAETKRYCHDMYMRNDTMWSSDILDGLLSIWNVRDKANPVEMATIRTPHAFTHNSWISDDAKYVFTTDERSDAYVAAYDVSDFSKIKLIDQWRPKDTEGTGVIPHNTRYLNGYLITAYYTDGVKIIDANKPDNLIEVGSVDTYFGNQSGFHGCWGVSPYLPSGTIVASDIEGGLFVIQPEYIRACYLEGTARDSITNEVLSGVSVTINAPRINNEQTNLKGEYKTGYAVAGTYTVSFRHPEYIPLDLDVTLENGVVTIKNVKLLKLKSVTQRFIVKDKSTLSTISNAHVLVKNKSRAIEGLTDTDGITTLAVPQDLESYDLIVGTWGYIHKGEIYNSLTPSAEITILIEKGYQDDFVFDLNWTEKGTATAGRWVRAEPVGTMSNGNIIQSEEDVDGDYGDECYVTGNGATDPSVDDVDGGYTRLTSPVMDLSTYNEPLLNYQYWFVNGGGNQPPNDKLSFKLVSGSDTFLVRQITSSAPDWRKEEKFNIRSLTNNLDSVYFIAETADDNPGHLVEAGLDAFLITEGNPVSTKTAADHVGIQIYPSLFSDITTVIFKQVLDRNIQIQISDLNGIIVEQLDMAPGSASAIIGKKLPAGIYIARISDGKELNKQIKLIKI